MSPSAQDAKNTLEGFLSHNHFTILCGIEYHPRQSNTPIQEFRRQKNKKVPCFIEKYVIFLSQL